MEKFELVKESFNVSAKAGSTWLSLDMSADCSYGEKRTSQWSVTTAAMAALVITSQYRCKGG